MSLWHKIGPNGELYNPTVVETSCDYEADAQAIEKAMKGLGTDEKAIINILGSRTYAQRKEIEKAYKSLFGKDMLARLKSELSGDFEKIVVACLRSQAQNAAHSLKHYISGAGTNEIGISRILATRTNAEIEEIKAIYKSEFGKELEAAIEGDTSGDFKHLLVALLQANRKEPTPQEMQAAEKGGVNVLIDRAKAADQAQELFNAGEKKLGTDEATFIRILAHESCWQLAAISKAYEEITSNSLLDAVKNELEGSLKDLAMIVVQSCMDRPAMFACLYNDAMEGAGTNEELLISLTVNRAEIDLGDIKNTYEALFGKSLADAIRSETGGDLKRMLLKLLNEE